MQPRPQQDCVKAPLTQEIGTRATNGAKAVPGATRRSRLYQTFFHSEDGAVTVDWVVLTAAIVGLGFAVIFTIGVSTESSVFELRRTIVAIDTGYTTTAP